MRPRATVKRCAGTDPAAAEARKSFETELREAIEEDVYRYLDEGEHEAHRAVRDFSFKQKPKRFDRDPRTYEFSDTWEWNCDEYTFRFVWCCYALAWSIKRYDEFKQKAEVDTAGEHSGNAQLLPRAFASI
jgi:hypothetical protein